MVAMDRPTTRPNLRPRVTILEAQAPMLDVFRDVIGEDGSVTTVPGFTSMAALAETWPDAIVLGLDCGANLSSWELVSLIRRHRTLSGVPIIVCTLDVAGAMRNGDLSRHGGVHTVQMPCDVELMQSVVKTAVGQSAPRQALAPTAPRRAPASDDQLPRRGLSRVRGTGASGW